MQSTQPVLILHHSPTCKPDETIYITLQVDATEHLIHIYFNASYDKPLLLRISSGSLNFCYSTKQKQLSQYND